MDKQMVITLKLKCLYLIYRAAGTEMPAGKCSLSVPCGITVRGRFLRFDTDVP